MFRSRKEDSPLPTLFTRWESHDWLRLLRDSDLMEVNLANSFMKDADELKRILVSILKTSKEKNNFKSL
jgi:hypothetical protein